MSLENKLTYLDGTKDAIKQAIIGKGVSVSDSDTFRSYATKIREIQSGGSGGDCPKYTLDLSDGVKNFFKVTDELHDIVLPSNMDNVISMFNCFNGCELLTSITLPDLPNVQNMTSCFADCSSLKSVTLPELPNVTSMSNCFYFCNSLTSITLPSSLPKVTNMYYCFYYCTSLTSITLPTSLPNITNMNYCFGSCASLTSITLPDLPKVTDMYACFYNCTSLQNLVIGNINPSITTLTNWYISYCTRLTVDSLVNIMNALPTTSSTKRCTIGTTNINKLSPEQLAIGTDKGWSIN